MLFGGISPVVRAVIGVVVLVAGLALHKVLLEVAGGAVIAVGLGQWLFSKQRGSAGSGGRGPGR